MQKKGGNLSLSLQLSDVIPFFSCLYAKNDAGTITGECTSVYDEVLKQYEKSKNIMLV